MKTSGLKVRTLDSLAAIESLVPDWRALERATPERTGFQTPAWRGTVGPDAAPRLVAVRENGRLVLLLPLQIHRLLGARVVCWLGEPLAQYGDALALPDPRRPDWLAAALEEMRGWTDVDLIALGRLRADSALAACGLALNGPRAADGAAPYVDLGVAPRRRRSIERRMKKLSALGPLRLECADHAAGRREAVRQALEFKRVWLKRRRRYSAALSAPGSVEGLLALAESGALVAHRLWAGERLVSVEVGLRAGTVYRSLIGAYDPEIAEAAPGHALTVKLFETLAASGVTRFDFLPPGDAYKLVFADGAVAMGGHFLALGWRGALAGLFLARLRPAAKIFVYGLIDRLAKLGGLRGKIRRSSKSRHFGKAAQQV